MVPTVRLLRSKIICATRRISSGVTAFILSSCRKRLRQSPVRACHDESWRAILELSSSERSRFARAALHAIKLGRRHQVLLQSFDFMIQSLLRFVVGLTRCNEGVEQKKARV